MFASLRGRASLCAPLLIVVGGVALALTSTLAPEPCAVRAQDGRRGASSIARTRRGGPRLSVAHRVLTGVQPKSVTLSPDGSRVWVCNFGRPDRDNVKVYDAETLELVGTVEFEGNAVETAFSPDGSVAYISNFRRHLVHEVDTETFEVRRSVEVGGHPKVITVAPDGSRFYVANWAASQVTEVDVASFTVTRRLPTGEHPRGMVLADEGENLYVGAMYSHLIHVFAAGETSERSQFRPCRYPRNLELSPDESLIYTSCSCCRQVRIFDRASQRMTGIATTGENPRSIDLSADGRWLAVADFDDSTVTLIDTARMTHRVQRVPGANQIVGVAVRAHEGRVRVYATSWLTGELIVLDTPPVAPIEPPAEAPPSEPEVEATSEAVQG